MANHLANYLANYLADICLFVTVLAGRVRQPERTTVPVRLSLVRQRQCAERQLEVLAQNFDHHGVVLALRQARNGNAADA